MCVLYLGFPALRLVERFSQPSLVRLLASFVLTRHVGVFSLSIVGRDIV
jgi:hypothetical protein